MIPNRTDAILRSDETILPTEGGIVAARQKAVQALAQAGLQGAALFSIELCIQEALVNAFVHGIVAGGGTKIRLAYALGHEWVRVDVEDNGCGFRETEHIGLNNLQEAGPRGLSLIQAFTSRMHYEGNVISMELDLDPNQGSSLRQIGTMLGPERGLLC
jgi:anti-sigma regulatory factor (Ser/Thr protein kinase)